MRKSIMIIILPYAMCLTNCVNVKGIFSSNNNGQPPTGVYTCTNGTAEVGMPTGSMDVEKCSSCNTGYTPVNNECKDNNTLDFTLHSNGVTVLCPSASVNDTGRVGSILYTKRDISGIDTTNADTTCTSGITDMSFMFNGEMSFNQDISHWDTSSVTTMNNMFWLTTAFNQDISRWDVSMVTNMQSMFLEATAFNQDISRWDVSMVTNMTGMFNTATAFDQDLSGWCVSSVHSHAIYATDGNSDFTTARQPDFASPPC